MSTPPQPEARNTQGLPYPPPTIEKQVVNDLIEVIGLLPNLQFAIAFVWQKGKALAKVLLPLEGGILSSTYLNLVPDPNKSEEHWHEVAPDVLGFPHLQNEAEPSTTMLAYFVVSPSGLAMFLSSPVSESEQVQWVADEQYISEVAAKLIEVGFLVRGRGMSA
jgi:hypothetical protein